MSGKICLGAIDIETKKYTLPSKASKDRSYECVDCKKRVILRQGNIRVHHFAHSTQTNTCSYYDHPNEAQIHKDAKLLIQQLLNDKSYISFTWNCDNCSGFWGLQEIPSFKYKEGDQALLEYRGPNGKWVADVALVNNDEVRCIIEIKNKHATTTERPEPWFEVDATSLHTSINKQFESKKELEKETEGFTPPFVFEIPCVRKNIQRKCYGSFCYNESWVRRIPGHTNKNTDNSCILCETKDNYIPAFDGSTGRFQEGCVRVCQECLVSDTYNKQIRKLYANDIVRPKKLEWRTNGSVDIKVGTEESYSKQEKLIIESTPCIWNKGGQEVMWKQEIPCTECGRSQYSPIFHNKKFHALCKLCLGNENSQANILKKIKEGKINNKEDCLIMDD
jgi:hypothetical protein